MSRNVFFLSLRYECASYPHCCAHARLCPDALVSIAKLSVKTLITYYDSICSREHLSCLSCR